MENVAIEHNSTIDSTIQNSVHQQVQVTKSKRNTEIVKSRTCSENNESVSEIGEAGPSWYEGPVGSTDNDVHNNSNSWVGLSYELKKRLQIDDVGVNGLVNGATDDQEKIQIQAEKEDAENQHGIEYVQYESELQMPLIMKIIQKDLSEPYSIYTYRYFIHNWPKLCFLVRYSHVIVN